MDYTTSLLFDYYLTSFKESTKRKQKNAKKPFGFDDHLRRFSESLRRTKAGRLSLNQMTEHHMHSKNLAYFIYRSGNKHHMSLFEESIIPSLIRLDLGLIMPEEHSSLNEDFIEYLKENNPKGILSSNLYTLFAPYRQMVTQNKIINLVPLRPEMEFADAQAMDRHFIIHVGPTNSGKTFHALERLKDAKQGIYLGPLRLLALEVYEKMQDYGTPCTMLTGQECIEDEGSRVTASTIEMADTTLFYDVAVIDEAQMVADPDRGHSWTKAILGLLAKEIHICMSPAAEDAVLHLIELCHDTVEIIRYERKTSLVVEEESFLFPESVHNGDALIVFSKKAVLDVAGRLEEAGIPASVIYGSLPPEIRRKQMHLFTDGETKVVVATDAIGMGLNLPVKRIVFIQTEKFDGVSKRPLRVPEILQIAGRAGRFGLYDTGYINAMGDRSLAYIRQKYEEEDTKVSTVSLGFPHVLLDMEEPLNVILKVWSSVAPEPPFVKINVDELLFLYEKAYQYKDQIVDFDNKRVLYKMISCPIDIKDPDVVSQWLHYCMTYTADVYLDFPVKAAIHGPAIARNETYYKQLDLYYQFSHRMGKEVDEIWLNRERERTETAIMRYLAKGKGHYITTCRYCGRKLPLGYSFGKCERCFAADRGRRRYTEDDFA